MRSAVRCYAPPVPALSPHAVKQGLVVRSLIVSFRLIYPTFVASCAFLLFARLLYSLHTARKLVSSEGLLLPVHS